MFLNISKNGHKQKVFCPVPFDKSPYAANGYVNLDLVIADTGDLTDKGEKEIEKEITEIKKKNGKNIPK